MNTKLLLLAALPLTLLAAEPPLPPTPPAAPPMQQSMPSMAGMSQPISKHVMYDATELIWGDAPPALGKGAQMVVLSGDPGQAGHYAIRLKAPAGFKVALHWHPTDEEVTIIEGDFSLEMGEGADKHAHTFGPGGYALLPARMQHAASTKDGATVQVSGMGPFEINYINPEDDPRLRAK